MSLDDRRPVARDVVVRLIASQFPQWSSLPVQSVQQPGWDNAMFRLGDEMVVRLPTASRYVPQVAKEQRWLPFLEGKLPVATPVIVDSGKPSEDFPWPWTILRWLEGEPVSTELSANLVLAGDLADVLKSLWKVSTHGGPLPGPANFHRGGDLGVYEAETITASTLLNKTDRAMAIWNNAMASRWTATPVWVHGDVAHANLLTQGGKLAAIIDFGSSAIGDPACDLVMAWSFFEKTAANAFLEASGAPQQTIARAKGWALWKALITLADTSQIPTLQRQQAQFCLDRLFENATSNRYEK